MSIERAAAALLLFLPIAFNLFFFLLARLFDYPKILRNRTEDILSRFYAGGVRLKLPWYDFMLTAVLLVHLAVLVGQVLARDELAIVPTATVVGVLAALVQFVGLARWPFLVPELARTYHHPPQARHGERRPGWSSSRSTDISAWRSASVSATSSPERGPCSSAWQCSRLHLT